MTIMNIYIYICINQIKMYILSLVDTFPAEIDLFELDPAPSRSTEIVQTTLSQVWIAFSSFVGSFVWRRFNLGERKGLLFAFLLYFNYTLILYSLCILILYV